MQCMTFLRDTAAWVAFPSALQGLRLVRASPSEILLSTEDPVADLGDMTAFAALLKVCCGSVDRLLVASPYPSSAWIGCLTAEGIRRVFCAPRVADLQGRCLSTKDLVEVPRDLCPALHLRRFEGRVASVCGCRFDLLLLGRRQFTEQCFERWAACRWMTAPGSAASARTREEPRCTSS